MVDYFVTRKTALRPDPDDTSPEVTLLQINETVSALRELSPWMKVSLSRDGCETLFGWVRLEMVSTRAADPFQVFDEPEGVARSVIGEIVATRLTLPPWSKVDILLSDGSVETGWIVNAEAPGDDAGGDDGSSVGDKQSGEGRETLDLGPNEIYRSSILLAQTRTGIAAAALAALIDAEAAKLPSGEWNKKSTAGTSSAAGLTQFLKTTWLGEARKPRTFLNERCRAKGYVDADNAVVARRQAELLALRFDPELSIVAAAEYGAANLDALVKAGLVPLEAGDDEKARFIYIAHHEGLGGARSFLEGSQTYSLKDLAKQVGQAAAQRFVDAAGGDATRAYRTWLDTYVQEKIQPARFRRSRPGITLPRGEGLKSLLQFDGAARPVSDLSSDAALAKAVQWRLTELGYLDPPADGKFGPVSSWALGEFCDRNGVSLREGFTRTVAQRLVTPTVFLPEIVPGGTWFDKVISAMKTEGHFISRHPDAKNIVYLEGASRDGRPNDDTPNQFNDLRIVFSVGEGGTIDVEGSVWDGTTEPGRYWTLNPMNPLGAARIAFGQYKAWCVGTHHPNAASAHQALVQIEPISVYRDRNKDFKRPGDMVDTGLFAINQHWGYDAPQDDLGRTSAGCLVGRTRDGHRKFMSLVKTDPRYIASRSYRFMTTVLPGDRVLG
ncbi:peptidoglycan-binding domain-containing protein [Aureimonas altamirensis]|uniref:peptidoglycan-binding domain-containing protein n=1 Tax=Aureimonas altamirensis TaxID=370622 RepID=UPI0025568BD1|nr:peptidoglycan-binding domain-containing protein [Aureimonas altamirensis]